tara:strand:+ start:206 stop:436 length:231 start_codon:yes stop_codon:yes gene_type:complete
LKYLIIVNNLSFFIFSLQEEYNSIIASAQSLLNVLIELFVKYVIIKTSRGIYLLLRREGEKNILILLKLIEDKLKE